MRLSACTIGVVLALLTGLAHAAEQTRPHGKSNGQQTTLGYGKAKALPAERAGPCAAHGPGFRAMPGSSSCLRVFGGVRMDVESRRSR